MVQGKKIVEQLLSNKGALIYFKSKSDIEKLKLHEFMERMVWRLWFTIIWNGGGN